MTLDEFLTGAPPCDRGREFINGELRQRPEASQRATFGVGLLYTQIAAHARLRRSHSSKSRWVRIGDDIYYPDLVIAHGRTAHGCYETKPLLIAESADAEIDPIERVMAFRQLPSLRTYAWIDCENRRIDLSTKLHGSMHITLGQSKGAVRLFGVRLDVGKFFDTLDSIAAARNDNAPALRRYS